MPALKIMRFGTGMKKKKTIRSLKLMIQGLPLAGAAGTVFLPLHRLQQQFVMLAILVWIHTFFISETFLVRKGNQ
jgi:hypothetical protein